MSAQPDLFLSTKTSEAVKASGGRLIEVGKKYKGQPFEVLLSDPQYAMWMLTSMHEMIKVRHPALFSFLNSRFGQPERTPDHNRLQNRFLDEDFALRFAFAASQDVSGWKKDASAWNPTLLWQHHIEKMLSSRLGSFIPKLAKEHVVASLQKEFEDQAEGMFFSVDTGKMERSGEWKSSIEVRGLEFEVAGADVSYGVVARLALKTGHESEQEIARLSLNKRFRVEIKPLVGDDYPVILRTMKAVRSNYLLVADYCGTGATWEEVVKVFALSDIRAVHLKDVESADLDSIKTLKISLLTKKAAKKIIYDSLEMMKADEAPRERLLPPWED